jgi:hypothetical protein
MGVTRISHKVSLNATRVSTSSYILNVQSNIEQKVKVQIKRQGAWLDALCLALIQIKISEVFDLNLLHRLLELHLRVHVAYRINVSYMS